MIQDVLKRLRFDEVAQQSRPLIGEDFVFAPANLPSGRAFGLVHEQVFFEERPLAVTRRIYLQHNERAHRSLLVTISLCWNGFRDAMALLARFPSSFQRHIAADAVVSTTERYQLGDFGMAWSWTGAEQSDVVAFVRSNTLVTVQGHDAGAVVLDLGREIDSALKALRTTQEYTEDPNGLLADVRRREGDVARVPAGGRLELGVLPGGKEVRLFFLATSGSVNRAPENPDAWYYRAGAVKGRQEVTLYRTGPGILPIKERLTMEIL